MQSAAPLADDVIFEAVRSGWELDVTELSYAPVGYGSWHWQATADRHGPIFITVDEVASGPIAGDGQRPSFDELRWAYGVPLALTLDGLQFARSPIPTALGSSLARIDRRWAVSVWPFIAGRSTHAGRYEDEQDATAVLAVLRALHCVGTDIGREGSPRRESFVVPGLRRLIEVIDRSWVGPHVGPHAAAADQVLHDYAVDIRRLVSLYDDLVHAPKTSESWVLTHGEPHAANVVFTAQGPVLIDWDTTKIAPMERDLWMVAADGFDVGDCDRDLLTLYRAQWDLSELADYAGRFANPDDDGPEGDPAWKDFMSYIERASQV